MATAVAGTMAERSGGMVKAATVPTAVVEAEAALVVGLLMPAAPSCRWGSAR